MAIILEHTESGDGVARKWFSNAQDQQAAARLELLCRKIVAHYGPAKAAAFTAPASDEDAFAHTARENATVMEAVEGRNAFKRALAAILSTDEIFRIASREAVSELVEIRELLRSLPE